MAVVLSVHPVSGIGQTCYVLPRWNQMTNIYGVVLLHPLSGRTDSVLSYQDANDKHLCSGTSSPSAWEDRHCTVLPRWNQKTNIYGVVLLHPLPGRTDIVLSCPDETKRQTSVGWYFFTLGLGGQCVLSCPDETKRQTSVGWYFFTLGLGGQTLYCPTQMKPKDKHLWGGTSSWYSPERIGNTRVASYVVCSSVHVLIGSVMLCMCWLAVLCCACVLLAVLCALCMCWLAVLCCACVDWQCYVVHWQCYVCMWWLAVLCCACVDWQCYVVHVLIGSVMLCMCWLAVLCCACVDWQCYVVHVLIGSVMLCMCWLAVLCCACVDWQCYVVHVLIGSVMLCMCWLAVLCCACVDWQCYVVHV